MKISRAVSEVSIDHNIGKEMIMLLENAKDRIIIISPWISKGFVNIIYKKAAQGISHKIFLVEDEQNYDAIEGFVDKKIKFWEFIFNLLLSIFSLVLFFYIGVYFLKSMNFLLLIASMMVLLAFILFLINLKESFEIKTPLNVRIQSKNDAHFLHLKAYLIDNTLFLGSANLTETGMKKSIESIIKYNDTVVIEEFLRYLDELEHKINLIPLDEFIKKYSIKTKLLSLFK